MKDEPIVPPDARILVTGAGGFVGGHVATALADSGYRVRGLTRRQPPPTALDPRIEWLIGDLRDDAVRRQAVRGVGGVVHTAGWVSLGADRRGEGVAINVDATRALLDCAADSGAAHFLFTSTLWTVGAGTAEAPACEESEWNLDGIRSPYSETKRAAERLVRARDRPGFRTVVVCPGLVIGTGDVRPTSTGLLLEMARVPVAFLPRGGIPVVDARVVALAHVRALERAQGGERYVVAGPYLSYLELAAIVSRITGRPRHVVVIPDRLEALLRRVADLGGRWIRRIGSNVSAASVSGGFLRLHVSGARADAAFDLVHPPPARSIYDALDDARRMGRAPWIRSLRPIVAEELASHAR